MKRRLSAKKKPNQPSRVAKLKAFPRVLKKHKLLTFLSLLLLLYPVSMLQNAYKDWDNAQLIKGLAQDFPKLVADIEVATNLDLEIKVDCMTTSEKLGGGVRTCGMSVGQTEVQNPEATLVKTLTNSDHFINYYSSESGIGYKIDYRNKDTCSLWFAAKDRFNIECLTAVREKNINLAKNLFTQVKNDQK